MNVVTTARDRLTALLTATSPVPVHAGPVITTAQASGEYLAFQGQQNVAVTYPLLGSKTVETRFDLVYSVFVGRIGASALEVEARINAIVDAVIGGVQNDNQLELNGDCLLYEPLTLVLGDLFPEPQSTPDGWTAACPLTFTASARTTRQ